MSAVLLFTDRYNYYLYEAPTSMRRSFDGLCGIVTGLMHRQLKENDIYIFLNKELTHIKVLLYEPSRFILYYERLHKGRFTLPSASAENGAILLSATDLLSMLNGLDLHRRKK